MGGVKEEEPEEEIEEVKAETEEMAVEEAGVGFFGCDPMVEGGGGGHARDLSHGNPHNVPTLPGMQAALDSGYPPDAPLFFVARRGVYHPALGISPSFAAPEPEQGCGGGGGLAVHKGGMDMEILARKTPIPHPRTNSCRGLDAK